MTHRVLLARRLVRRLVSGTSTCLVMRRTLRRTVVAFVVDRIRCLGRLVGLVGRLVGRFGRVGRLGAVYRFFFLPDWFEFGLGLEWSHVWSHVWVSPHIGVCSLPRMDRMG